MKATGPLLFVKATIRTCCVKLLETKKNQGFFYAYFLKGNLIFQDLPFRGWGKRFEKSSLYLLYIAGNTISECVFYINEN